ncbi:MAG: hypothetical protein IPH55_15850 [Betaproteobacteria bacterium]|nr:hypothetical protein [Betaproteobacteria bacterium]
MLLAAPGFVFPKGWAAAAVPPPAAIGAPFLRWDRDGASYRGLVEVMPTGLAAVRELRVGVALDIEHHQQFMQALGEALLPALAACLALAGLLTWLPRGRGWRRCARWPAWPAASRPAASTSGSPSRHGAEGARRPRDVVQRHAGPARGTRFSACRTSRPTSPTSCARRSATS